MCHQGPDEMEFVCGFDMSFSLGWMHDLLGFDRFETI